PPAVGSGSPALTNPGEFSTDYRAGALLTWAGKNIDWNSSGPPNYTGYQWPPSPAQLQTALSRINLNRRLTPYPLYDSSIGGTPGWTNTQSGSTYTTVFNQTSNATQWAAFQEAQADRQKLADDIYRRLLLVTGVPPSATPSNPTAADLAPRRALA